MARIEDGTGLGYVAAVSSTNRLLVSAESIPSLAIASASRQDAYVANTAVASATGLITGLVAGVESGVVWIQNLSPVPLSIGGISAGTTGAGVWKVIKNPTSAAALGTVITPVQLNASSSKAFTGAARAASASGQAIVGGTVTALGYVTAGFEELQLAGALILGASNSVALTFTPIGGNADVSVNVICGYFAG